MALVTMTLSLFASIDILMLGKFVPTEYLAYYRASLSLIMSIASLLSLSTIFLPIFTQISGKRFRRGANKTLRYMLILSLPSTAGIIFLSKYLIKAFYGDAYLLGTSTVYFLSGIIIFYPLIHFYSTLLESKEKSKIVSKSIIISLIFNIFLNILLVYLFKQNPLHTINAVALSTSISNLLLLFILTFQTKKHINFYAKKIGIKSIILATLVMSAFLLIFNYIVDMNIFLGIIEVIVGVGIYFVIMFITKGITREDLMLIKNLYKK
jgi:O-antigen/teichoic acid export membrane protein